MITLSQNRNYKKENWTFTGTFYKLGFQLEYKLHISWDQMFYELDMGSFQVPSLQ